MNREKFYPIDRNQCLDIQAWGLGACKSCPFDYPGPPHICGGGEIKRLIERREYPREGKPQARFYLIALEMEDLRLKELEKIEIRKRVAYIPYKGFVLRQERSSWRNLVNHLWGKLAIWLEKRLDREESPYSEKGDVPIE